MKEGERLRVGWLNERGPTKAEDVQGTPTQHHVSPKLVYEGSLSFSKSAAHRDKSREWGRLKAKVEPLLTLGNSGVNGRLQKMLRTIEGWIARTWNK